MDFFEVVKRRRSVRAFTSAPIADEKLEDILRAINSAPSAGNLQAYEVVVVRDQFTKEKLAKASLAQKYVAQAPLCLVFLANPERSVKEYGDRGRQLYCVQDASIAACHAHLACVSLGNRRGAARSSTARSPTPKGSAGQCKCCRRSSSSARVRWRSMKTTNAGDGSARACWPRSTSAPPHAICGFLKGRIARRSIDCSGS